MVDEKGEALESFDAVKLWSSGYDRVVGSNEGRLGEPAERGWGVDDDVVVVE